MICRNLQSTSFFTNFLIVILLMFLKEEYKKMEVCVFEMETKIASLEEEISAIYSEKEEILSRNEDLASQLEVVSEKLKVSNEEMNVLHEEFTSLVRLSLPIFFLVLHFLCLCWTTFGSRNTHERCLDVYIL